MVVRFLVLDTKYYDGTESGYNRAVENAKEVVERDCKSVEAALKKWRKKYPKNKYDFDDIRSCQ